MFKFSLKEKFYSIYGRLHFDIFSWFPLIGYRSYLPDAFYSNENYPELKELYELFIKNSKVNNRGDLNRLFLFILNVRKILEDDIDGDFAELGVYQGATASILAHYVKIKKVNFYLFDTFCGFDQHDLVGVDAFEESDFSDTSLKSVSKFIGRDTFLKYCPGHFPSSLSTEAINSKFAFVHLDCDLYMPMRDALTFFWPRLTVGGMIFLHDYSSGHWIGAKKAIDEFCNENKVFITLVPDKSGTAIIRKQGPSQ